MARHLDRLGTSDFAWWRLDLALRPAVRLAMVGVLWLAHLAVAFLVTGAPVADLLLPASATAIVLARGALIAPRSPAPKRLYSAWSFAGSMRSQAWRALLTVVVSAGFLGLAGAVSDVERIQAWVLVGVSVLWATIWGRYLPAAYRLGGVRVAPRLGVPGVVSEHSHTESGNNRLSAARELSRRGRSYLLI